MFNLEDDLGADHEPFSVHGDMVGAPGTHRSRWDCHVEGTLKDTGRRVTNPELGWKATVLKCSVCGRENYVWKDSEGYTTQVEYYDPDGKLTHTETMY